MIGISKEQQLKKNRINKKPSMKNKSKINQWDKEYLDWLNDNRDMFTCLVCGTSKAIEFHHVKNKSTDKKDHTRLIPLCMEHHRYSDLSPHGGANKFRETYPLEMQLKFAKAIHKNYKEL